MGLTVDSIRQEIADRFENEPDSEKPLFAEGFDDAILGLDSVSNRVVYSVALILNILTAQNLDYEEAFEHFEYNIKGSYVGPMTPIYCETM